MNSTGMRVLNAGLAALAMFLVGSFFGFVVCEVLERSLVIGGDGMWDVVVAPRVGAVFAVGAFVASMVRSGRAGHEG